MTDAATRTQESEKPIRSWQHATVASVKPSVVAAGRCVPGGGGNPAVPAHSLRSFRDPDEAHQVYLAARQRALERLQTRSLPLAFGRQLSLFDHAGESRASCAGVPPNLHASTLIVGALAAEVKLEVQP